MGRDRNIQLPLWQQDAPVPGGSGQCWAFSSRDVLGKTQNIQVLILPAKDQEEAQKRSDALDMAQMLMGSANIVCHQEHWVSQTDGQWEVCVREAYLPDLNRFCADRAKETEELIALPADPGEAAQALAKYREKQRLPEETVVRIGCDICRALEQCREKGLERCAVTMETVKVSPGGAFALTGLGMEAGERPAGTLGLAQLLCRLLGGEKGKPAFGEEALRSLVEKACAKEMDVRELWNALERIARGEPEPEEERAALLRKLQKELTDRLNKPQADSREIPEQKLWSTAGDLPGGKTPVKPLSNKDYTLQIRQKAALSAVISAGDEHSVALLNNGTAVASGKNANQQCQVGSWRGLQAVSAGDGHTVGLTTEGRVVATGNNGHGQCAVGAWQNIVQVCAGYFYTVGLRSDGTVVSAGKKDNDRCATEQWKNIAAIAVGVDHTVGLRSDGTVLAAGSNKYGQCNVQDWQDIVAVCAGAGHTVGLKADGTVVAAGWGQNQKCDVSGWKNIVAISAGVVHTVGLQADGRVVATGNRGAGRCDVSHWKDVAAISAGRDHTLAVCVDGSVLTAGSNALGQSDIGAEKNVCVPSVRLRPANKDVSGKKNYTAAIRAHAERGSTICAGYANSAAVLENGTVVSTNTRLNTRAWRAVKAVAVGTGVIVGLRVNGTVLVEGSNVVGQSGMTGWTDILQVTVGDGHTVALRSDGTVVAAGRNDKGQCNVDRWTDVVAIAVGAAHTLGLRSDGTVLATGNDSYGQCRVGVWQDIIGICAGKDHSVGLKADGTVVAAGWGQNQKCDVFGWKNIVAISAGMDHTVGLKADGSVVAAGRNVFNQCAVSKWKEVVAVSAGQGYTLGLRRDGSVVATGLNTNNQCRVAGWRNVKQSIK